MRTHIVESRVGNTKYRALALRRERRELCLGKWECDALDSSCWYAYALSSFYISVLGPHGLMSTAHRTIYSPTQILPSRVRSFGSRLRRSVDGTNRTSPPVSTLLAKAAAPTAASEKAEVEKRKLHYAEHTFEARTWRLVHCWKASLVPIGCMLLQYCKPAWAGWTYGWVYS